VQPLCAFDLDHTLVRSSLDLVAMKIELRAFVVGRGLTLPEPSRTWTIGQLIDWLAREAPGLEAEGWAICADHEHRAVDGAMSEPGAHEALDTLRAAGYPLAVWTNNARVVTESVLVRCGLAGFFGQVVTRDEAALKPDPAGLRLLQAAFPDRRIWVVGDSWVDGAAAHAGGAAFIAYGADPAELARRGVAPRVVLHDLRAIAGWLETAVW
jgi:phosphoglycolate phosphatase-like HAD superfamily hydrolase